MRQVAENAAQLAVSGATWLLPEGRKGGADNYSRFEELRTAGMEFAPLRGERIPPGSEMLVDMAQQGRPALRFAPYRASMLMAGRRGAIWRGPGEPDGVFDAQMGELSSPAG
ncbi:MAG: hypothetical protein ACLSUW_06815 [Akkermansia sp.]